LEAIRIQLGNLADDFRAQRLGQRFDVRAGFDAHDEFVGNFLGLGGGSDVAVAHLLGGIAHRRAKNVEPLRDHWSAGAWQSSCPPADRRNAWPVGRSLNLTEARKLSSGSTYTCQPVSAAMVSSKPSNSQSRTSALICSLSLFQTKVLVTVADAAVAGAAPLHQQHHPKDDCEISEQRAHSFH
jgi:hypothetical protein